MIASTLLLPTSFAFSTLPTPLASLSSLSSSSPHQHNNHRNNNHYLCDSWRDNVHFPFLTVSSSSLAVSNTELVADCNIDQGGNVVAKSPTTSLTDTLSSSSSTTTAVPNADDVQLFLRFSPLIGGPAFLPLHVEVILVDANINNDDGDDNDTVEEFLTSQNNSEEVMQQQQYKQQIHRFDFLPAKPEDPSTIIRLISLQSVTGRVRYRTTTREIMMAKSSMERNNPNNMSNNYNGLDDDDEVEQSTIAAAAGMKDNDIINTIHNNDKGKGITFLFPIGSIQYPTSTSSTTATAATNFSTSSVDQKAVSKSSTTPTSSSAISTAIDYVNQYRATCGRELRIVGGKNCLSFALDLLFHLDSSHGIKR